MNVRTYYIHIIVEHMSRDRGLGIRAAVGGRRHARAGELRLLFGRKTCYDG